MKKMEMLVDELYQRRHQQELDTVFPVLGGEGMGKSTLILQIAVKYCLARDGVEPTIDELLDRICFNRAEFQEMMAESDKQSLIIAPDAARILYSMDVAKSEQKQIEKDLMDVRGLEYFILLGFQSWDRIGGEIKERRAKLTARVPRRGLIRMYDREAMDHRIDEGEWPSSTLTDKFPSLDGTELWRRYKELDQKRKRERLAGEGTADVEDVKQQQHRAYALRLVRPWNPHMGMSYREASNHHKFSKDWIGETVRDWKDGKYQDLIDTDDNEIAGGQVDA